MARTPFFHVFSRLRRDVETQTAETPATPETPASPKHPETFATQHSSRRAFLRGSLQGSLTTLGALGMLGTSGAAQLFGASSARAAGQNANKNPSASLKRVAIVGGGLAGLVAADTLEANGVIPTIFEADTRLGGRCYSMGGTFAGPVNWGNQVIERGGELIDNFHKTMLAYANEFNLAIEDLSKQPGEDVFFIDGILYSNAEIQAEYRDFVGTMRRDLTRMSTSPTAARHNNFDAQLDQMSLAEYLDSRGASTLLQAAIRAAYEGEYGLLLEEQSALNFLLYIHADKRSRFTPFGVFSDERYHIVGGNEQIPRRIAARLQAATSLGQSLVRIAKTASGQVALTFRNTQNPSGSSVEQIFDEAIIAVPFSVLRHIDLDVSLGINPTQKRAIAELGYGDNTKTMIRLRARPWLAQGSNGTAYADLPHMQVSWESNPTRADAQNAIITDFASGPRAVGLVSNQLQTQATAFLQDLDNIYGGVLASAQRQNNQANGPLIAHVENWSSQNVFSRGSYTCYRAGQFTGFGGSEGDSVGNLHFAGEHTDSFYSAQGFMEGACLSGIRAADEVLANLGKR